MAQDGEVQTVRRAIDLIEILSRAGEPVSVSEIADRAALPVPSVYRILRTLVVSGYVRQLANRRYVLGTRLIGLGKAASASLGFDIDPFLRELVEATGETSNFAVLEGDSAVYVAQAPSPHSMRMFTEIGRRVRLHSTGVGKAILAQLPDERVLEILERAGMPAATDRTLTSAAGLLEDLARIRVRGWSIDDGEQEPGVTCVAVALPSPDVHAAISVSAPASRLTEDAIPRVADTLRRVAIEIMDVDAEPLRTEAAGA